MLNEPQNWLEQFILCGGCGGGRKNLQRDAWGSTILRAEVARKPLSLRQHKGWSKVRSALNKVLALSQSAHLTEEHAAEEAAVTAARATHALLELAKAKEALDMGVDWAADAVDAAVQGYEDATAAAEQAASNLVEAARQSTEAMLNVSTTVSVMALHSNASLATAFIDAKLRGEAPALRHAIGEWLIATHALPDGMALTDALSLKVCRPAFDELQRLSPGARGTGAAEMLPVLSIRLHPAGEAPPASELFEDQASGDFPSDVLPIATDRSLDAPSTPARGVRAGGDEASPDGSPSADGSAPDAWDREHGWPAAWQAEDERRDVVMVDFDLDVACRLNWEYEPLHLAVESSVSCLPKPLATFALKAFVLRARARCWFHLSRLELKLCLHDEHAQFRSHTELGLCGCCAGGGAPDYPGLTSRLVRHYLHERITPETPLEITLAQDDKDGELCWTSSLTGQSYSIPLLRSSADEE